MCSEAQIDRLLEVIQPYMADMALNTHGTRVIQKLTEQVHITPSR